MANQETAKALPPAGDNHPAGYQGLFAQAREAEARYDHETAVAAYTAALNLPDLTLEEIKEHFSDKVDCSIVAVHNALKRLGWRYKKNRYGLASKIEKM